MMIKGPGNGHKYILLLLNQKSRPEEQKNRFLAAKDLLLNTLFNSFIFRKQNEQALIATICSSTRNKITLTR